MPNFSISVSQAEQRRLKEFLGVLRTPCQVTVSPKSSLIDKDFESEFRSKLLTHHCFMGTPLFQESFESAFISACTSAGHTVNQAPSGQRFWDLMLDGKKISLKSSKAGNLRQDTLHISKLTEAAWIQDCRSAATRREHTFQLFRTYCDEVDAILQLRYFAQSSTYELVEIPVPLFSQVFKVKKEYFSADGPTINIPVGKNPPDFTVKLDRSDAKITLANINKTLCLVHASWRLL